MTTKLTKKQLEKQNLQFTVWAKSIREELKPDEDGEVRAIIAIIPSFTGLALSDEIKFFMDWCKENNFTDLFNEWVKWTK